LSRSVVIGGGPAGLTAAYELSKLGHDSVVLEADFTVGGISRTCEYKGYRFDIGGHRFFTKVDYVNELWHELLGDEMLKRPRLSRIYYRNRFFDYPLKPVNAVMGLGLVESFLVGLSYLRAHLFPTRNERTFQDWITNRFGKRLFEIFFKTYTEKVWGMPCDEISADWAAQRIKNLDLVAAVKNAILGSTKSGKQTVTTLIDEFEYPRHGPGQMWVRCAERLEELGRSVHLGTRVTSLQHDGRKILSASLDRNGQPSEEAGDYFLSSMPIQELVRCLEPAVPEEVRAAADRLRYRDFLTVVIIVDQAELFPDNWIYIHSDEVKVGRIQNFKNWSPFMVPDPSRTALGLEYFVQEGDEMWSASDDDLIALGRAECDKLGLAPADLFVDGTVIRMPKAYPVYDGEYQQALETIRGYLERFPNLQLIGRNGQHRYNNQDHSMLTAVLAARNIAGESHEIWEVNTEETYHEEQRVSSGATGDRAVPARTEVLSIDELIREAFAPYDAHALGTAVGSVIGVLLFLATVVLLLAGGDPLGPNLSLLGSYLVGFKVSWAGAFIGFVEGALGGFAFGFSLAKLINWVIEHEERRILGTLEAGHVMDLFEGEEG